MLWPKVKDTWILYKLSDASLAFQRFGFRYRFLSIRKYSDLCWYYCCFTCSQPGKYRVPEDTWKVVTLLHAQNMLFLVASYYSTAEFKTFHDCSVKSSGSNLISSFAIIIMMGHFAHFMGFRVEKTLITSIGRSTLKYTNWLGNDSEIETGMRLTLLYQTRNEKTTRATILASTMHVFGLSIARYYCTFQ